MNYFFQFALVLMTLLQLSCDRSDKYSKALVQASCDDIINFIELGMSSEMIQSDIQMYCDCVSPILSKSIKAKYSEAELKKLQETNIKRITTIALLMTSSEEIQEEISRCAKDVFGIEDIY